MPRVLRETVPFLVYEVICGLVWCALRVRDSSGKPGAYLGEDLERMARRRVFEPERPSFDSAQDDTFLRLIKLLDHRENSSDGDCLSSFVKDVDKEFYYPFRHIVLIAFLLIHLLLHGEAHLYRHARVHRLGEARLVDAVVEQHRSFRRIHEQSRRA